MLKKLVVPPDLFKKIEGTPEKISIIHNNRSNMLKMLLRQKRGISPNPLGDFMKSPRGFHEIPRFAQI